MRARTPIAILAAAGFFAVSSVGGAVAAGQIGSAGIADNAVRSLDLKDGAAVGDDDLKNGLAVKIAAAEESAEIAALQAQVNALSAEVDALQAEDESGVNKNWVANDGAEILDADTVVVSNEGTPAGSSVEIANLDLPVQATKTVEFTYELADGAVYGGGSPRVFLEINGDYVNTFDSNPEDAGTDNGDGTFTKTWTIPSNGRVGNAGVVQDSGTGSITVSNLVISGTPISFQ